MPATAPTAGVQREATRTASRAAVGAVAGMGAWLLVLAGWRASDRPVAWLTGPTAQAAYATVALVLLALLVRSVARQGWALPGGSEAA